MTLQQLEYLVALDKHRHFVRAAQECGVTQPTLSAMISKLEEELEVSLFDRKSSPIEPTPIGRQIIDQARVTIAAMNRLKEFIFEEKNELKGGIHFGIIPTVAPYLLPRFIASFQQNYPEISIQISEMKTSTIIENLLAGKIDMGILATPLNHSELLEIPLYYERFVAYISPCEELFKRERLQTPDLPMEKLWVLMEGHCMRNQIFNFCDVRDSRMPIFEAGSIDTLIRIVDSNGGYTLIPELHIPSLTDEQRKNLRPIESPPGVREISMVIRKDFVRERLLNAIAESIKSIIPSEMIDKRLARFAIRL